MPRGAEHAGHRPGARGAAERRPRRSATRHDRKLAAQAALLSATKTLEIQFGAAANALRTYETAVNTVADGDASIINKAGLLTRATKTPPAALGSVVGVHSVPGKLPAQAILRWPEVARATSYAIEVNMTPAAPAGPWTAINPGSSRRRVLTTPTPATQMLARVAAVMADGTQSAWSNPVLVTTR